MKELEYPFDAQFILKKRRSLKRELLADGSERIKKRIAVLGGSTADDIVSAAELFLLNYGIETEFWVSEYNKYYEDGVFGNPELDEFKPDIVWVCTSSVNLKLRSDPSLSADEAKSRIAAELDRYRLLWDKLKRFGCPIIQNNFDAPFYALMGSMDSWDVRGAGYAVNALNMGFAEAAQNGDILLLDLNRTAAEYGLDRWYDRSSYYMFKYMCARDAMPNIAYKLALIIKSIFGKNRKLMALDLDNTMWGGIVGDDGVDGLEIGQETGTAQSYYEFQQYVKDLAKLGAVLTVCSKNEEENAIAGLSHPEGAVTPADFALIKANWEPKDRNLLETVQQLDLLPSAIVFADDNPAERAIVRRTIPEAAVPELDGDRPESYIQTISAGGHFEPTAISADDLARNEMYKRNAKRAALAANAGDYGEYLASLEMKAEICAFKDLYLKRIAQLTNKSNQFNLTTRRFTAEQLEGFAASDSHITLYGKLTDNCGDNGVVSVVVGEIEGDTMEITLWLMSCRVLKREMELAMLDVLVRRAKEKGVKRIVGVYLPTAKNKMVERLYPDVFGFSELGEGRYELLTEGYEYKTKYIDITED
ncbi:HAD-superfamily phosphatase, subfamily IIIC/FkbH-like domain-containing protein [Ruminococcus sp. YE71]|uniref:HAD-IIIC family phosphatase n=1 Tax=unclassified Ruminococcus TaxID=2608920 RepID=UPI0008857D73|nr:MULTISPECIES: HAD-IIIC family phosphatase [unclassified Ruminococcus]SDA22798.1 HAD-superfamily phosphatase, subfamily IIIC/FkbH-like domain-containing protein [Ruminococcus sp. YE78]SFW38818.1 HAD-superfamily phosphatase, subfamily IIIC/FkbH-like domain-containing protein [Ruminococcus sp. YE71]